VCVQGEGQFSRSIELNTNMQRGDGGIQNPTFGPMRFTALDCDDPTEPQEIEGWTDVRCGTCLPFPGEAPEDYTFVGYRVRCGGLQSNLTLFTLSSACGAVLLVLAIGCCCCVCRARVRTPAAALEKRARRASVQRQSMGRVGRDVTTRVSWQTDPDREELERRLREAEMRLASTGGGGGRGGRGGGEVESLRSSLLTAQLRISEVEQRAAASEAAAAAAAAVASAAQSSRQHPHQLSPSTATTDLEERLHTLEVATLAAVSETVALLD
jgi:hypothetical protein